MARGTAVKRSPDTGVATAVSSVIQHATFKRMLMFGLRSLSDYCLAPTLLHKENALDALERGVVPAIATAVKAFGDDEDIIGCSVKVLYGISMAVRDDDSGTMAQKLVGEGGVEAVMGTIQSGVCDSECIHFALDFIENMVAVGVSIDGPALGPGLVVALGKESVPIKTGKRIIRGLSVAALSKDGAMTLGNNAASTAVVGYLIGLSAKQEPDHVQAAESAMEMLKMMADHGSTGDTTLNETIALMEAFKAKKSVASKGSAALSAMIGPEQLHGCLNTLKSAAPDSPEREKALTTLGCMSYISSYTDDIVEGGGVPLLIDLVNSGVSQLGTAPEQVYPVIAGAARMLGRIAANPTNLDQIVSSGGVASLCTAISYSTDNEDCTAALCEALTPLVSQKSMASEVKQYQTFATVLPVLCNKVENKDFAKPVMEFIAAGSQHEELHAHMIENQAVEIIATCTQYHTDDAAFELHAISALIQLAGSLSSVSSVYESGGLAGLATSLSANAAIEDVALASVRLTEMLANVPDAPSYMEGGQNVDAVLEAILVQEHNESLVRSGVRALELIATESDCARHLKELELAVQGARNDPEKVFKTLAAVGGLSRVSRLQQIFEQKSAAETVLQCITWLIEGHAFEGQAKVIQAGIKSAKTLKLNTSGDLTLFFVTMAGTASLPQLKRITELQEPDNNVLIDFARSLRELASLDRVAGRENLTQCVEIALKFMRKYQDSRRVQILCMETLDFFAAAQQGEGLKCLIEQGGISAVVNYLNRAPMYVDAQIGGFTVLATCVKVDPASAEVLRKCNALTAVKTATRTHSKSKGLKRVIAPLAALLMPTDHLEREIKEKLQNIENAIATMNAGHLHENMMALNDLLVSAEGSKIAARNGAGSIMAVTTTFVIANAEKLRTHEEGELSGEEFYNSSLSETAQVLNQTAATRVGRVALTKADNVESLILIYENLAKQSPTSTTEEGVVRTLDGLRVLMRHDKNNADVAFTRGCVATLCRGLDKYPDSENVLAATCGCLASMATTPSRVELLIAQPEFELLLEKLMGIIKNSQNRQIKVRAIEALQDLLETSDPTMANKIAESGGVNALFQVLEQYPEDAQLSEQAAKALALIGNFEDLRRFWNNDLRKPAEICTKAMKQNRSIGGASQPLLDVMNKMTTPSDKIALKEAGCMEVVAELMTIHADNEEVVRLGGELFSKMGADEQIKGLMVQIINAEQNQEEGYVSQIDGLCVKLAMFLAAPVEDTAAALSYTEQCLYALNRVLNVAPGDMRLQANVAMVAKRLCDRCFHDAEDSYGAWAFTSAQQLNEFCDMLNDPNHQAGENKRFLTSAYRALAATCVNPYSRPTLLGLGGSTNLLPRTYELLEQHKSSPEVVARILEFLAFYGADEQGAQELLGMSGSLGDIVQTTLSLMNMHKQSDPVYIAGTGLLGNLAACGPQDCHPTFSDGRALRDCEGMVSGSLMTQAKQIAIMGLIGKMLQNGYYNNALKLEKVLDRPIGRIKLEDEEKKLSDAERANLAIALSNMIAAAVAGGMVADVEKAKGIDALIRAIEEFPEEPEVIKAANRALTSLALADLNMAARAAHEAVPKLCMDATATIQTDPECADTYCDLTMAILSHEGNGRALPNILGFDETLQGIEQLGDYYGDEYGQALKDKVVQIRQCVLDDQPRDPTCKDFYELLLSRHQEGQSNSVSESPLLLEKFEFLFTQMNMYGQEQLNSQTAMGQDHQYGNMAFQLLIMEIENVPLMIGNDFVRLSLATMKNQKDEEITHLAVVAMNDFCKHNMSAQTSAKTHGAVAITSETLNRLQKDTKSFDNETRESMLIPRVQLIERMAVTRGVYSRSKVVHFLINLWNDYDNGIYSSLLLRHVFRAMRKVVSDMDVDVLLKSNVLSRLKDMIDMRPVDLTMLPDVLFLFGSLGVVPEIKTSIGEKGGIEACIKLLRFALFDVNATAVVTNCCLAMANICIGHKRNISLFAKLKGEDLNVEVLNTRGNDYDISNAGSVLLCNLLFKSEEMKKLYGVNGAPATLVQCLKYYDGNLGKSALRCLQSLFKAISNLSLYTPNVKLFLEASMEGAYQVLLENTGSHFPDSILETALRTFANLTMENEELYMQKFGVCLDPLMAIAKQGRTNTHVLLLLLDIQNALCRHLENAKRFAANGGIDTTIKIIHQFDYDVSVLTSAIHLLGIQSGIPSSIGLLVGADVFSILVGCCDVDTEGNEVSDLVVGSLRCARRIIQTQELALMFCEAGGITTLKNVMSNSTTQPVIALESYRLLLNMVGVAAPAGAGQQVQQEGDEFSGDIGEEQGDAPFSGSAWLNIGLDEPTTTAMVEAVCATLLGERHLKQLRLQRNGLGLCTYFVTQKVSTEMLIHSRFSDVLKNCLENFVGDNNMTLTTCIAINNLAKTSGDLYETVRSKELLSAVKTAISKIPGKDAPSKELKAICQATYNALSKSDDPFVAFEGTKLDYDIGLSDYHVDPYPNGVQDLPSDVKAVLRKGSHFKLILPNLAREDITWRASQDLHVLEWIQGQEKEYSNRVPIVRVRNIAKGLSNEVLQEAHNKEPRRITASLTMCIYGPASEEFSNGLSLSMKAKTKKDRDHFVEQILMWRDAASYNY